MQKIYLYFLVLLSPFITFSQDFTATAEQETRIDEYGNALNNVTDKQDLKQGNWFYVDINGNQVVKKVYEDDQCQGTYFFVNGTWIISSGLSKNANHEAEVLEELKSKGVELSDDQQLLLILSESGEIEALHLMGNWAKNDETKVFSILEGYVSNLFLSAPEKTYILL